MFWFDIKNGFSLSNNIVIQDTDNKKRLASAGELSKVFLKIHYELLQETLKFFEWPSLFLYLRITDVGRAYACCMHKEFHSG